MFEHDLFSSVLIVAEREVGTLNEFLVRTLGTGIEYVTTERRMRGEDFPTNTPPHSVTHSIHPNPNQFYEATENQYPLKLKYET
jgi:hypothetical protein